MADRDDKGRFAKGWKGGPGRKKNRDEYRAILHPHMPQLLNTLIEMAKAGDIQAIKLILERMYPTHNAQADELLGELEEIRAMVDEQPRKLKAVGS